MCAILPIIHTAARGTDALAGRLRRTARAEGPSRWLGDHDEMLVLAVRTNIDIDDDLMETARQAARRKTKKATVEEALRAVSASCPASVLTVAGLLFAQIAGVNTWIDHVRTDVRELRADHVRFRRALAVP